MACIATTLTVLSTLTAAGQWNDISVNTNSRIVENMNVQTTSRIEMLSDTVKETETFSVICGEDIYAATASVLETTK